MSEGDLLKGSPEDTLITTDNPIAYRDHCQGLRRLSPSPTRSRSQSAGSAHKEALLFFERHQLLQTHDLLPLPGGSTAETSCDIFYSGDGGDWAQIDNSTEISSLSKSPSPAHFSDLQSSSAEEHRFLLGQEIINSGNKKGLISKREKSILKVRSANNLTVHSCKKVESGGIDTVSTGGLQKEEASPVRLRSIRGRSHSQPSQVILGAVAGERCNSRKRDSRNWLEQIQFTAQYKHYRTNDYASVVNSASSLDQVGVDQGRRAKIGGTPLNQIRSNISRDRENSQASENSETNHPDPIQDSRQSGLSNKISCFNFPRVKLRRIFNAKSLDDILGRSRKTLVSPGPESCENCDCCEAELSSGGITEGITGGATTTSGYFSDVTPTKSKNSSLTSLKIYNPSVVLTKSLDSGSSTETVGEASGGGGNSSTNNCQQQINSQPLQLSYPVVVASSVSCEKPLQTTSSSSPSSNKSSRKSSSQLTSTLASVLLRVPHQFHFNPNCTKKRWTNLRKDSKEKPSKSQSFGSLNRVLPCANAKSDNYLNRIVSSATCARFSVANSVEDNFITNTNTSSSSVPETRNNSFSCTSCSTIVEPFISKPITTNPTAGKQRNWTAVKQKWDLKLQPQTSSSPTNTSNPQNILFIKSNLSRISGVDIDTASPPQGLCEPSQLESLTSYNSSPIPKLNEEYETVRPHEPGRVSFRLEPEEIPSTPTISRSQSSDCKPHEIDPNLILNTPSEEESEEMTKSRHFHYKDISGASTSSSSHSGSRLRKKDHHAINQNSQNQPPEAGPNKGNNGTMTTKEKAQLVVANVTYLQRPTSPCVMSPGDSSQTSSSSTSHFQQSSSPIVFTNNNNFTINQNTHSQSITSPGGGTHKNTSILTKPESSSAYNARMRQEYLSPSSQVGLFSGSVSSGAKNINQFSSKEPQQIEENNINKSSRPGGSSSFVPCYNPNDVLSPTKGYYTSGANAKPSLFGGSSSVQDSRHDDLTISSYVDNRGNKNVTYLGGSSSSPKSRDGNYQASSGSQPIDRDQSSKFHSGFTSDKPNNALGDRFTAYHGKDQIIRDNQTAPEKSVNRGNQEEGNNLESEEVDNIMGDLQSPTYVKRTAHMFNSRYSSPQHNGSSSSASSDHIKENRNPSYLNVSRSVSGYSCLSYSNGNGVTTTTTNGSTSSSPSSYAKNGSSPYSQKFTSPSTKIRSEFTVKVNQPSNQIVRNSRNSSDQDYEFDDDHQHHKQSIKSPTKSSSNYAREPLQVEETIEESSYVPSHGKSFIMQRIERLYGSDAVSSSGVFSRKSTDSKGMATTTTISFESSLQSSSNNSSGRTERVIPIQIEQDDYQQVAKEHYQEEDQREYERHIRGDEILISKDSDRSNEPISPTTSTSLKMKSATHISTIRGGFDGIALEPCPGKHRLQTISLDEEEKMQLMRNGDRSKANTSADSSFISGRHVNGNYTNGSRHSHNSSKNDSGIVLDDKELNMGPSSDEFGDFDPHTNANDPIPIVAAVNRADNKSPLISPSSGDSKPSPIRPVALMKSILTADDSGILDAEDYSTDDKPLVASLYSHRKSSLSSNSSSSSGSPEPGPGSPSKPKIKPKPKDMALLRTLSHSPTPKALLTERSGFCNNISSESQDKTGMYSNISLDKILGAGGQRPNQHGEDRVDSEDSNKKLSDIRNILKISSHGGESPKGESDGNGNCKSLMMAEESVTLSKDPVENCQKNKENDFKPVGSDVVKNGNYFLIEMNNVKKEMQRLVDKASIDLEKLDPQGDVAGNTLSAIGKANLLMKKKFKQFEELCNANLKGVTGDQPPTTDDDLAGFWDMVMIQVEQVYDLFKDLDGNGRAQSTDAVDGVKTKVLLSPKKTVSSSTKVLKPLASKSQISSAAKARDESRRKMIAERRRLMKDQAQEDVLIFTPDQPQDD